MFNVLLSLVRGAVGSAEREIVDRDALPLLDQQIRNATTAVEGAR